MNLHKKVRADDLVVLQIIDMHTTQGSKRGATQKCVAKTLELKSLPSDQETIKESFDRLSMHGLVSCRFVHSQSGFIGMWTSKPAGHSLLKARAET